MASSNVRVVPVYDPRGLVAMSALWGAGILLGLDPLSDWLGRLTAGRYNNWITVGVLHVLVLAPVVLGAVLAHAVQRGRLFVRVGLACGAGALCVTMLEVTLWSPDGGADVGRLLDWEFLAMLTIIVGVALLGVLTGRWLVRGALFSTTEQSGRHCWRCGYDLAVRDAALCPECATPMDAMRFRCRWALAALAVAQRASRPLLVLTAVVLAVWALWLIPTRTIPVARFMRHVGQGEQHCYAWMDFDPDPVRPSEACSRWVPLDEGGGETDNAALPGGRLTRVLVASLTPGRRPSQASMRLRVASFTDTPNGATLDFGLTIIESDLTPELTEQVLRSGIPPALIAAMRRKADAVGWAPTTGKPYRAPTRETVPAAEYFGVR